MKHYRGEEYINELKGLKCFNEDKYTITEDKEYIETLEKYIQNYEKNIMKKKGKTKKGNAKN